MLQQNLGRAGLSHRRLCPGRRHDSVCLFLQQETPDQVITSHTFLLFTVWCNPVATGDIEDQSKSIVNHWYWALCRLLKARLQPTTKNHWRFGEPLLYNQQNQLRCDNLLPYADIIYRYFRQGLFYTNAQTNERKDGSVNLYTITHHLQAFCSIKSALWKQERRFTVLVS